MQNDLLFKERVLYYIAQGGKTLKHYIVLDTETYSNGQIPFEVSWKGIDEKGNTLFKRGYLIKEIAYNKAGNFNTDVRYGKFSRDKIANYEKLVCEGKIQVEALDKIREQFYNDIVKLENVKVCAYNADFDKRALNNAMFMTGADKPFTYVEYMDIWQLAKHTIMNTKKYAAFCVKNGLYGKTGIMTTSAEAAYRYIKDDMSFIESHIGLDDIDIEGEILITCLKSSKKKIWDKAGWTETQKNFKKMLAKVTE